MPSSSRIEMRQGLRAILPLTVAVIPIGLVFGAVASTKGLSPAEATLMSAFVFAGGSQFVAMDIWSHPASWVSVGLAALLVNLRHVLMAASILPKMTGFRPSAKIASLLFLADEIWAMAEFRARDTPLTPAFFAGLVVPFYAAWVTSALAGALLGGLVGDAALLGLDFAFPAVFIILLMGFRDRGGTDVVLVASAAGALLVHQVVPGVWYIAVGALAGMLAAALMPLKRGEGHDGH